MPRIKTTVKIKDNFKGLRTLSKRLDKDKALLAEVGHFGSKIHPEHEVDGTTIAGVSLINQTGYTAANGRVVPARPYMMIALESPVFKKAYREALNRVLLSNLKVSKSGKVSGSSIAQELPKLAELLRDIMVGVIQTSYNIKRNAEATIDKKGFDHPLVETGTLMNDIEFRLVKDIGRRRILGVNKVPQ